MYNLNSGYGQITGQLPLNLGKVFVVADNTNTNFQVIDELFTYDPEGVPRRHSTIDSAINACTANNNDVILVAPGHTETLESAAAIALDVAGVIIIGVGEGNNRPVLTFATSTAATFTMAANNCVLKNVVLVANIDSLVNALVVSGDNCTVDVEFQDTSASVEAATAIRLDTANNAKVNLKYLGFTAGNAVVSAIRLDGCANVRINIDGYGVVTTAWVEMVDVASTNVHVTGTLYTQGVTDYTRDVVDTITGSIWSAKIYDASAGLSVEGGSAGALAAADAAAVAAAVSNLTSNVATLQDEISGAAGVAVFPAAAAPANAVSIAEVVRVIYDRQLGDGTNASANSLLGKRVLKNSETLPATTTQNLFTVSGGRVLITKLVGEVTTVIQSQACNAKINNNPTVGSTVVLATNVDIDSLELGATLTVEGDGTALVLGNGGTSFNALGGTSLEVAEGVIELETSATNTGATKWELWYVPLDDGATVT